MDMSDQGATSESSSTPRGRSFVWLGVVLAAAVVWGVMRTGEPGEPPGDDPTELLPAGAAAGFNLLFVTIDTTRPDHLGCYGDAGARTPALDALAERGVRFADATVHVPLTLPSHATMLTGRYPPAIGVRTNGDVLSDRHATLAEVLSSNGYATAAFVATYVLDKRWGLAQGFDTYDFRIGVDDVRGADSLMGERKANEVSDSVLAWLKKRKASGDDQPFFAWVHYYDPHHPYVGPQPLVDRFTDRSHPTYDAEIALVDIQLERIFDRLRREGLWEKTLVVVATDHGESLGDIAEAFHGIFLYETTMRAALLFSNPRLFERGFVVRDRVVGLVDIFPSILHALGIADETRLDGENMFAPADPERAIYIETRFPSQNSCRPLYGLRRHHDKYIAAVTPEYFDLRSDPHERANLHDTERATAAQLAEQLADMREQWNDTESAPATTLDPEARRRLEALGYAGDAAQDFDELPDCKEHIEVINAMSEVTRLKALERFDEAIELAREVASESGCWYPPYKNLADTYRDSGAPEEARAVFEDYLNTNSCPPTAETLYHFSVLLFLDLDDAEAALAQLAAAEAIDPNLGVVYMFRAEIFIAQGRNEEALQQYDEAIRRDPARVADDAKMRRRALREEMAKPDE
jgi:choline-sulfatase